MHSVSLKHCQRIANSSPGRRAFVMSVPRERGRSDLAFRSSFESAPRNCRPVKIVRSVSRRVSTIRDQTQGTFLRMLACVGFLEGIAVPGG